MVSVCAEKTSYNHIKFFTRQKKAKYQTADKRKWTLINPKSCVGWYSTSATSSTSNPIRFSCRLMSINWQDGNIWCGPRQSSHFPKSCLICEPVMQLPYAIVISGICLIWSMAQKLACGPILSRSRYFNSLRYDAPCGGDVKLQRLQNNITRFVLKANRWCDAIHLLHQLQWLPTSVPNSRCRSKSFD